MKGGEIEGLNCTRTIYGGEKMARYKIEKHTTALDGGGNMMATPVVDENLSVTHSCLTY